MSLIKKFISFIILVNFTVVQVAQATPPVSREILFPPEGEIEGGHWAPQKVLKRFPKEELQMHSRTERGEGEVEVIFSHKAPGSIHSNIYYFKENELLSLTGTVFFARHEESLHKEGNYYIVWSGCLNERGAERDFFEYSVKNQATKIIAKDFERIYLDKAGQAVAGLKALKGGIKEYWVNTSDKGWTYIATEADFEDFSPHFMVSSEGALFYDDNKQIAKIDLKTGERHFHDYASSLPKDIEGCALTTKNYASPFESALNASASPLKGKTAWEGSPIFKYIYHDLCKAVGTAVEEEYDITYISPYLHQDMWYFGVNLPKEPRKSGSYNLATRQIEFEEQESFGRRALKNASQHLSQKEYRIFPSSHPFTKGSLLYSSDALPLMLAKMEYVTGIQPSAEIPYFLSLPQEGQAPYPTVVFVHGGPAAHDEFGFEPEVQHLTTRGYAVVQPEFRGSTANRLLFKAGFGEWGKLMQQDVYDIVDSLVQEGTVDTDNVAVMGGSYGGYFSLLAATVGEKYATPRFSGFKCAIPMYGPSSLELLLNDLEREFGREDAYRSYAALAIAPTLASEEDLSQEAREKLQEVSPLTFARQTNIPLLIMHGRRDIRVPQDHSDRFSQELEKAGIPHTYVLFNEDHGWRKRGNQIAAAYLVEEFLSKYLRGGTVEPATVLDAAFTDLTFVRGAEHFPTFDKLLKQYQGLGSLRLTKEAERFLRVQALPLYKSLKETRYPLIPYQNPLFFMLKILLSWNI